MFTLRKKATAVISVDPLYVFDAKKFENHFYSVVDNIIVLIKLTLKDWVWSYHRSPERLKENRMKALQTFLQTMRRAESEKLVM